jgi:hypothetical protein
MVEQDEIGQQDCAEGWCPRKNDQVLIMSSTCFYSKRNQDCAGCVFDRNRISAKLVLLMCRVLEARDKLA